MTISRFHAGVAQRRSPAQACATAVKSFAALSPPTTLAGVASSLQAAEQTQPSADDLHLSATSDLRFFLRERGADLFAPPGRGFSDRSLQEALSDGDGPLANKLLSQFPAYLATIQRLGKKEHLPAACSKEAFGASYVPAIAALVESSLRLTGVFAADAGAACGRLGKRSTTARTARGQQDLEFALADLDAAFRAFRVDLQAIAAPPGAEQQYAALRGVIDQAVSTLDHANNTVHGASQAETKRIGQQISALAPRVTAATSALGLNC